MCDSHEEDTPMEALGIIALFGVLALFMVVGMAWIFNRG